MTLCVDHDELHLTYFLRNLYKGQETTVRIGHGKTEWFKIGKKFKAVYCHPAYLTFKQCVCVCARSLNHVLLGVTPWTVAHQVPLSMGFPR